jgi:hypothetical protein
VRHADDGRAHGLGIGPLLQHDKAFASMPLARRQFGPHAAAHLLHGVIHRNGVLHAAGHAGNTPDGVRVPLAQALAPVGGAIGQQGLAHQALEGEQARVPAGRDQRRGAPRPGSGIHAVEVLRDARVGVEAVDQAEMRSQLGGLPRQVVLGATAQHQHVDACAMGQQAVHAVHRSAGLQRLQRLGVAAGIDAGQRHVGIAGDGRLHATAQVAVADDGDADGNGAAMVHAVLCLWDGVSEAAVRAVAQNQARSCIAMRPPVVQWQAALRCPARR